MPWSYIFKTSLAIRTLPNEWKHANITAIFKKGRKNFTTKLQTHKPDFNYMQNNGKHYPWCNNQSYEKQQIIQPQTVRIYNWSINSTTATTCIRYLVRNTRLGGNLDVIYCDFMKAFDKVPHKSLIYKTNKYGISGNVLGWISSFLNDKTQCVNINNETSASALVTSGIPQGSVLGPLLFVIHINNLPQVVNSKSFVIPFCWWHQSIQINKLRTRC